MRAAELGFSAECLQMLFACRIEPLGVMGGMQKQFSAVWGPFKLLQILTWMWDDAVGIRTACCLLLAVLWVMLNYLGMTSYC